jgi:hypothetical protein
MALLVFSGKPRDVGDARASEQSTSIHRNAPKSNTPKFVYTEF